MFLARLTALVAELGHCAPYTDGPLVTWMESAWKASLASTIHPALAAALTRLGMNFDISPVWLSKYQWLKEFYEAHGTVDVLHNAFMMDFVRSCRTGPLTDPQRQLLAAIGFPSEPQWAANFVAWVEQGLGLRPAAAEAEAWESYQIEVQGGGLLARFRGCGRGQCVR